MAHRDLRLNLSKLKFDDLIIYEDEFLFCLNKPPGVSSLDERNQPGTGLLEWARRSRPTAQLCHRLDRMTSGALVFAKSPEIYREISLLFQNRKVYKAYHTLVKGVHRFDGLLVEAPIGVSARGTVRIDLLEGKECETLFFTEKTFRSHTLVRAEPKTGRQHQIRLHMSYIHCPILGDELYGGQNLLLSELKRKYKMDRNAEEETPINDGYLLHARILEFKHPKTGETLHFEAEYSKNFGVCLKILEKYDQPL